jgi:hypothetical protein
MNITQRQNILNVIEQIEQLNLVDLLNKQYPTEGDAHKITIGNFNAAQFIQLLQRITSQLKSELNEGLGLILPQSQNFNNDYGSANLESDFTNIHSWLSTGDFASAATRIESLIYYQVINGFWEKHKIKIEKSKTESDKLVRELAVVEEKLKGYIDRNQELVNAFNLATENVNTFLTTKKEEFTVLTTNQQTSNTTLADIQNILTEAKVKETNIENIVSNQTKKQTEIETEFDAQKLIFEEYKKTSAVLTTQLNDLIIQTISTLDSVNLKLDEYRQLEGYIETKNQEIVKLTGFAADTVLAHSFDKRAGELKTSVNRWGIISAIVTALTVGWIFLLITDFGTNFHLEPKWDSVFLNFLKTSPLFVALGFALTQYSKERSLLEDYAFKAAVALTINPYADKLDGIESNRLKQQLIVDSIMNVYSKPIGIYNKEENPTREGFKAIINSVTGDKEK